MENFIEVQKDFENFNNLDYLQKLALIDKYQIECLIANINFQEKRLDKYFKCSNNLYNKISSSENLHNFNLYNFSPKSDSEYSQLLSWLRKRNDFCFKTFEVIKDEFLEAYKKANNKDQVFNDFHKYYELKIKGEVLLSDNHLDNQVYRAFYDFGVKDFNYGNKALEGLTELLFETGEGVIYADKGTLNISKIVEYCCFYFQGIVDANLLFFLQNEKDSLGKVITPAPAEQKGFDLGLTEEQLKVLHQQLVNNNFLDPNTKQEHFIKAFNDKALTTDYKPIEWVDLSRTRKEPNARTLFEFLYLLRLKKEVYDTSANNSNNFYRIIERVFKSLPNLTVKNPYSITQKTPRHKLLKTIIESL